MVDVHHLCVVRVILHTKDIYTIIARRGFTNSGSPFGTTRTDSERVNLGRFVTKFMYRQIVLDVYIRCSRSSCQRKIELGNGTSVMTRVNKAG